jgi:hypothetical protein
MSPATRHQAVILVLVGVLGSAVLVSGCGDSGSNGVETSMPSAVATSSAPSAVLATPSTPATPSSPPASASSAAADTGASTSAPAWQATTDESSTGSTVAKQFLNAIDAQDLTLMSSLMAPGAESQLEDITKSVRRIALTPPRILVVPDPQGPAHLAMMATGRVEVVAASNAGLGSGAYTVRIDLRRDSRRDEWLVGSFDLQPL